MAVPLPSAGSQQGGAGPPWRRIPVDGAALQCHILILFMTPSMVMSHLPLEPQPGVLYRNLRIIVISSSLMAATCLSVYLLSSSSMSTLPSNSSSEVEHQHVVPAALPLVPPVVLHLQGEGLAEEDGDAPAHVAVDGGAGHEGVAARLQAEAHRGCSRGRGCSPAARTAPPRQKNREEEARDKKNGMGRGDREERWRAYFYARERERFANC